MPINVSPRLGDYLKNFFSKNNQGGDSNKVKIPKDRELLFLIFRELELFSSVFDKFVESLKIIPNVVLDIFVCEVFC